ncbi:MAG: hypothetical protein PHC39_04605 [Proteiniphilum sp.]|nr:hypothetical protein [Proteiniphilum sp.]
MPNKHGPGTHLGYTMPAPGDATEREKHILRIVYGECRSKYYPGESQENKARCAKIAWSAARRR